MEWKIMMQTVELIEVLIPIHVPSQNLYTNQESFPELAFNLD